jgi:N-acetylmuramoyl-L-alanine amidase
VSASPNNPGLGSVDPTQVASLGIASPISDPSVSNPSVSNTPISNPSISNSSISNLPRPDHHDLETLLALSSLHEQIRERRDQELSKGARLTSVDGWELKQFVHDEVLQLVADRALMVTGADGVAVALVEGTGIVCRASAGKITPERGARLDPHSGFSGACLRNGVVVKCDDSELDSRVNPQACQRLGARSMVAVPLSAPQAIVGIMEAFSSEPFGFNDCDVRCLTLLAALILDAMNPAEEDLLSEMSHRVVGGATKIASVAKTAAEVAPHALRAEAKNSIEDKLAESAPQIQIAPARQEAVTQTKKQDARLVLFSELENSDDSRPGLKVVLLLVAVAVALGIGLWSQIRHSREVSATSRTEITPVATNQIAQDPMAAVVSATQPDWNASAAALVQARLLHPGVTGIRHWASANSSTVVIELEDQVQYEAHRLANPERIYFDLLDTKLAHELSGKTIDVGDPLLQRIRIAQPTQNVTRVVLDTKNASNYSVSLEPSPYRLVVEVGRLGSTLGPKAKVDLFGPENRVAATLNTVPSREVKAEPTPSVDHRGIATLAVSPLPQVKAAPPKALVSPAPSLSIVLDAGHGGWDLGTVGRRGLLEKDLVLDIVQRLGGLLQQRLNANVVYTRQGDSYVPLERRAEIANLSQAKLFISIHANYSDSASARGVETYYTNTYSSVRARPAGSDAEVPLQNVDWTRVDIREKVQESRHFADCVQQALYGTIAAKNPGIPNRGVKEAQYVVLTGTSMPAILAEVSFVSSPTDESELLSEAYRQRIAEALFKGIARYHETPRHATIAGLVGKTQ